MTTGYDPSIWQQRRKVQPGWPHNPLPDEDRDRARIIHSAAFRRLQTKTQVLGVGESDFHRTRLTHTMEVAQIGRVIVIRLSQDDRFRECTDSGVIPTPALIEAICFAHDLGHPPFGHCGETALNHAMRDHGGFEGNGQSLRIVSKLEPHTPDFGLNLTRRTLLGILKYPATFSKAKRTANPDASVMPTRDWHPPKCYLDIETDVFGWIMEPFGHDVRTTFESFLSPPSAQKGGTTKYRSFDTSILNLADDIAYNVHDLEDGIALRMISRDDFVKHIDVSSLDWARPFGVDPEGLVERLFGDQSRTGGRREAIGSLFNALVCSVTIQKTYDFACPHLAHQAVLPETALLFLNSAHGLIVKRIINTQEVQTLEFRGMKVVSDLFNAIISDPQHLLGDSQRRLLEAGDDRHRVVCDYVAGMTDVYANRFHERLYGSRQASVFERL